MELLIKEGLETAITCPDSACPKRGHLQENEVFLKGDLDLNWNCLFVCFCFFCCYYQKHWLSYNSVRYCMCSLQYGIFPCHELPFYTVLFCPTTKSTSCSSSAQDNHSTPPANVYSIIGRPIWACIWACLPVGGQSEGKTLLVLQAVWLMYSLAHSLGLWSLWGQHSSAHRSFMFLINQCHWPLMELLAPSASQSWHPCLFWQRCLHLVIECSFTKPQCSFHWPINEYIYP